MQDHKNELYKAVHQVPGRHDIKLTKSKCIIYTDAPNAISQNTKAIQSALKKLFLHCLEIKPVKWLPDGTYVKGVWK